MKTKLTHRRLLTIVAVGLGCALVILTLATLVAANGGTPTVNGLFYGDGDQNNYYFLGENLGRGKLYYNREGNTLYLAVVVDISVNDNVFGYKDQNDKRDEPYWTSAGWNPAHTAKTLIGSDHVELLLSCGTSWRWQQDYLYNLTNENDPTLKDWLSDTSGPDGNNPTACPSCTSDPPELVSASSLQWNMNNTLWDVTLGDSNRNTNIRWKSVDVNLDNNVTDEVGWGTTWWENAKLWEWAMVYEMRMDVSACGSNAIIVSVPSAHNSPSKDDNQDVPICPDGCPLQGLGDYVWWDDNGDGVQNDGDNGLDGVIVELYNGACPPTGDPTGDPSATDTTSGGGYYYFGNLPAGQYCVNLADSNFQSGGALYNYRALTSRDATDDTLDSDFDNTTHTSWTVTLAAGKEDLTIDAGVEYTGPPTAVTLSSFAAKSSAGGSASGLWLGLVGLTVLAAGFWVKRRVG